MPSGRFYISSGVEVHFEDYRLLRVAFMSAAAPELEHLGLTETCSAVLDAASLAIASEMEHRKAARFGVLGRTTEEIVATANMYNDMAIDHADAALSSFRAAREAWSPAAIDQYTELFGSPEGQGALARGREYFGQHLTTFDFSGEEMAEILAAWNRAQAVAIDQGVQDLADHLEDQLIAFIDARRSPTRGTQPGFPLPWWKIALVAVVLCVAIGFVIDCYAKRECKDVWSKLLSAAPSVASIVTKGC